MAHDDTYRERTALAAPLRIRGVELKNRMVLAPMQVYSAVGGFPTDWHFYHLAKFAQGGFGVVFTEALAVQDVGRNTYGDLGVWSDDFVPPLRRIAEMLRGLRTTPAAQLFHAGPKASRQRPWEGYGPIGEAEATRGEPPWQPLAPSPDPRVEGWVSPRMLSIAEIDDLVSAYGEGARRCAEAGFDVLEIHGAHGYLIHSFYSPLGNDRTDSYGGGRAGRMRFPLEVAEAVRAAWPPDKPLLFRMSCIDGEDGGWNIEDSIALTRELALLGVDLIDCSSLGIGASPTARVLARVPGFQVHYAERIRRETGVLTMAVGLILTGRQAEDILEHGGVDLICVAREALYNPNWALHAVQEVGGDPEWRQWPPQYGWWLSRRAEQLRLGEIENLATRRQRR